MKWKTAGRRCLLQVVHQSLPETCIPNVQVEQVDRLLIGKFLRVVQQKVSHQFRVGQESPDKHIVRMSNFEVLHQIGKVPLLPNSVRLNRKKIKMERTRDLKKGSAMQQHSFTFPA